MRDRDNHDLNVVMSAAELVPAEVKRVRKPNGITQYEATARVIEMVGYEADLRYIRDLVCDEYGRFVTLGCVLREKMVYRDRLVAYNS